MLHIGVPPPPTERSDELLQFCVSVEHVNTILNKNSASTNPPPWQQVLSQSLRQTDLFQDVCTRASKCKLWPSSIKICISKSLRIPTSLFISYHLDGEMVIKSTFTEQRRSGLSKLWGSSLLFQTLNHRALLYSKTRAVFEKISQKVWKTKPWNNTKLEDINIPVFPEQIHHQNSFVCLII